MAFSKEFFQVVFEESPIPQILVNGQGEICLINRAAATLFKHAPQELMGKKVEVLIPSAKRASHQALVKSFFSQPEPRSMGMGRDLFGIDKLGNEFPIEVGLNPLKSGGKVYVMASVVDISERLKEKERFRLGIDAAPTAMIMVNSKGEITMVNQQTEAMFGYDRNELLGQKIELLVPQEVRAHHPSYIKAFVRKPEPRAMGKGRELYGQKKDGSLFPVEVGLTPIETGEGLSVISSVLDISERVRSHKKLTDQNEELQQFSYRTSHDLKAPLKSIAGLASFIEEDVQEGNIREIAVNAQKISYLSQKLSHFVSDILNLTRAEYSDVENTEWNMKESLQTIFKKLDHMASENQIQFHMDLRHDRPLYIDGTRINQILENLISNSIKYHDPAKTERFVEVLSEVKGNLLLIEVKDNGQGIPPGKHTEVFRMFSRFHRSSVDGSGLGLYLVKKLIDRIQGKIRFESSEKGTTFFLTFKIEEPSVKKQDA